MFRSMTCIALLLAVTWCTSVRAEIVQFAFLLEGTQQVPPNASPGSGVGLVTLDTSTNLLSWNITFENLTSAVTAAYFHGPAMPGVNAAVRQSLIDTTSPSMSNTTITDAFKNEVLAELWYVNIHTTTFPGGEIRGQVVRATATTYQGQLKRNGTPVNGVGDMRFSLFGAATGGTPVQSGIRVDGVTIANGLFTAGIRVAYQVFGNAALWLEIEVAFPAGAAFTLLSPRQPITPTPRAVYAQVAQQVAWADLTGVPSIGDITGVTAGAGLTGGGTSGSVTLFANFAGSGAASTVARSDHAHHSLDASDGAPVEVVFVDAGGQVGINTTAPTHAFEAVSRVAAGEHFEFSSTVDIPTGNDLLSLSATSTSGDGMQFIECSRGSTTVFQVNGDGAVGIGRTNVTNRLEVEGNASKTTAGSWIANSDARIKADVRSITNALEKLSKVRLVSFRYNDEYLALHPSIEDHEYVNVIAQEYREVFPGWVKGSGERLATGEEILQVDTYPITIYSAAAIQELQRQLRERDERIAKLEQRLDRIERRLQTRD